MVVLQNKFQCPPMVGVKRTQQTQRTCYALAGTWHPGEMQGKSDGEKGEECGVGMGRSTSFPSATIKRRYTRLASACSSISGDESRASMLANPFFASSSPTCVHHVNWVKAC